MLARLIGTSEVEWVGLGWWSLCADRAHSLLPVKTRASTVESASHAVEDVDKQCFKAAWCIS